MRVLALLLAITMHLTANPKAMLHVSWMQDLKGDQLFLEHRGSSSLYDRIEKCLLEHGSTIEFIDQSYYLKNFEKNLFDTLLHFCHVKEPPKEQKEDTFAYIFWNIGNELKKIDFSLLPREKLILFLWEPPTVEGSLYKKEFLDQFSMVFTWDDDLVDNKRFFKFHYPVLRPRIANPPPFKEKKFCTLINSRLSSPHPDELYSEREKIIRFFEDKMGFDLYGRYWAKRNFKNYKGEVPNKRSVLESYRFCICYENMKNVKGYITEKIFDCFEAAVVPVYWGASNISEIIPKSAFIDRRDFASDEELYHYLKNMSEDAYNSYLQASADYLTSPNAGAFSEESFINETFLKICNRFLSTKKAKELQ